MNGIKTALLSLLSLTAAASSFGQATERRDYMLPSWGDIVYSYGPGVDPALDSPAAFEHMIKHWQGRGCRGVFLRTDLAQLDPDTFRRNPVEKAEMPRLVEAWKYIDEVMARFDVQKVGNEIAEKNDFEFWAWHAHMFSDGAPETAGAPGPSRMWPWSYVVKYTYEHPDAVTTDRTQKKRQWMVREYGYPEARATKVAEFVYMAKKFGLRHFVVENRSEASQMQDPPDKADRFGFNEIVVKDMRDKYGVDILTDPRFDVDSAQFNTLDPMVENWHKLRGEYFTQFLRDLRKALNDVDPKIQICTSLAGDRIGPPMGNWFTDWRKWVDEGLIDGIISPCDFDAYPTAPEILNTYITCAKQSRGMVPLTVFHNYIKASQHPNIKIITGGSHFLPNPPTGGDGWRITDWYDSYQMAWYQRWGQLMKDVDEFGYIKFFEQSFDDFPVNSDYHSGAWGNKGYVPALRATPGVWARMGKVDGTLPSVQSDVRYGSSGNAVKLTSDPTRSTELIVYHSSTVDRSQYYSCIEPAISNGRAEFEFRIFRQSDDSGITAYFQNGSDVKPDIAIRVAGGSGELSYSQAGTWKRAGITIPKQSWQQIRITVDFTKQSYSASLLSADGKTICNEVPYVPPDRRMVAADDGSARQVELKSYKMLNQLDFAPEGKAGSVTYLDDVIVRWVPVIPYDKPAKRVVFADDFERFDRGAHALSEKPQTGAKWDLKIGDAKQALIENEASYGEGVKSLRIQGKTELHCALAENSPAKKVVLDIDVFVRSDAYYVTIMPSTPTKTKHILNVALAGNKGSDVVGLKNDNGHWSYLQDGGYKKTDVPVALDCWNHIQIDLDAATGSYKIVLQPVGEMPAILASGKVPAAGSTDAKDLVIRTDNLDDVYQLEHDHDISLVNFSCIDNVCLGAE